MVLLQENEKREEDCEDEDRLSRERWLLERDFLEAMNQERESVPREELTLHINGHKLVSLLFLFLGTALLGWGYGLRHLLQEGDLVFGCLFIPFCLYLAWRFWYD